MTLPEITTGSLNVNVPLSEAIISLPTEILAPLVSITNGSTTFISADMVICPVLGEPIVMPVNPFLRYANSVAVKLRTLSVLVFSPPTTKVLPLV